MLQNRILPPRSFQFRMQIGGCLTRLDGITLLAQPPRQRRKANAQILRDLPPRPAAGQCQPHRFTPHSGVGLFPFPMEHLLVPQLVLSTFSGEVQSGFCPIC